MKLQFPFARQELPIWFIWLFCWVLLCSVQQPMLPTQLLLTDPHAPRRSKQNETATIEFHLVWSLNHVKPDTIFREGNEVTLMRFRRRFQPAGELEYMGPDEIFSQDSTDLKYLQALLAINCWYSFDMLPSALLTTQNLVGCTLILCNCSLSCSFS